MFNYGASKMQKVEMKKFSEIITLKDVAEADYNISPSRFVSAIEEEKYREIGEIKRDLQTVEKERQIAANKINKILGNIKI